MKSNTAFIKEGSVREKEIKAFAEVNPHRNDNHNNKTVQRFESWKKWGGKKEMEKYPSIPTPSSIADKVI